MLAVAIETIKYLSDIPECSCSKEDHQQMPQVQREGEHQHADEGQNVHNQRRHPAPAEKRYRFIKSPIFKILILFHLSLINFTILQPRCSTPL